MKPNVLIVGSGGENKYDYLEWLARLGANVILLEPQGKKSESKYETHYSVFNQVQSVIAKAKDIASKNKIFAADTIFELTMEHSAEVRKALNIPGLTKESVDIGRDKTVMARFMQQHGIRTAPFITFNRNDDLKTIQRKMQEYGDVPWILKPDRLGANIGVRIMKDANEFPDAFKSAQYDIENHPYRYMTYYKPGENWIVCHYIRGHEIETEVCVCNGKVIFSVYLFKTISVERERAIEENRYITPPPWLTRKQLKDLDIQIRKIGKAVWENVMKPSGKNTLVLHPEFLIDKNNHAYTLEFAFRNGGGLNPYRIEDSTGINPYYLSAAATLGIEPRLELKKEKCASGYQMLFADRPGKFEGVRGIRKLPGIQIKPEAPIGYKVSTPQAEVLTSVIAKAPTPEEVDKLLNESLREAKLIVNGKEIDIPLSKFAD